MIKKDFVKELKKTDLTDIKKIMDYVKFYQREIYINVISPEVAEDINKIITFWNTVDEESMKSYAEREPIKVFINSEGGLLDSALVIMDILKISKTPIYTINIGKVNREAFYIYMAGHKRLMYPNAFFCYQAPKIPSIIENKSSFYNYKVFYEKTNKELKEFILDKIKITDTQYENHSNNDWWFHADDATKLGICNEIIRTHFL